MLSTDPAAGNVDSFTVPGADAQDGVAKSAAGATGARSAVTASFTTTSTMERTLYLNLSKPVTGVVFVSSTVLSATTAGER